MEGRDGTEGNQYAGRSSGDNGRPSIHSLVDFESRSLALVVFQSIPEREVTSFDRVGD
jgi:hypothetical protein